MTPDPLPPNRIVEMAKRYETAGDEANVKIKVRDLRIAAMAVEKVASLSEAIVALTELLPVRTTNDK